MRPDRQRVAAAGKHIGGHARLHVRGQHGFLEIIRLRRVNFDLRVGGVEIFEQKLLAQAAAVLEGKLNFARRAGEGTGAAYSSQLPPRKPRRLPVSESCGSNKARGSTRRPFGTAGSDAFPWGLTCAFTGFGNAAINLPIATPHMRGRLAAYSIEAEGRCQCAALHRRVFASLRLCVEQ